MVFTLAFTFRYLTQLYPGEIRNTLPVQEFICIFSGNRGENAAMMLMSKA